MEYAHQKNPAVTCSLCGLSRACLPNGLGFRHIPEIEKYIRPTGPLRRGEHLFHAGDPISGVLLIQSGCFKLYGVDQAGREYIPGFRLPGDAIGLHGFYTGIHQFDAIALTPSTICRISTASLNEAMERIPGLFTHILRMLAQELVSNTFLSGNFSAEERVTAFLANFKEKLRDSQSSEEIYLPMSRGDIAVYLHLALATVSRVLSRLQRERVIASDYHHIRILDQSHLDQLCRNVPFAAARQTP